MGYKVRVYDTAISAMHQPGGEIYDEARDIARATEVRAISRAAAFSPVFQQRRRPEAHIIDSHRIQIQPSGRFTARSQVVNDSEHALYKHNGTRPIITSPSGRAMMIPAGPWGPRKVYAVSGQIGDPWLLDAANDVLSRYGVRAAPY